MTLNSSWRFSPLGVFQDSALEIRISLFNLVNIEVDIDDSADDHFAV